MPTNIDCDSHLLSEAVKLGGFKHKEDAVNAALKEYIVRRQQVKILDLFGTIDYYYNYDYKKMRKKLRI